MSPAGNKAALQAVAVFACLALLQPLRLNLRISAAEGKAQAPLTSIADTAKSAAGHSAGRERLNFEGSKIRDLSRAGWISGATGSAGQRFRTTAFAAADGFEQARSASVRIRIGRSPPPPDLS
jgi:hypothetical protein